MIMSVNTIMKKLSDIQLESHEVKLGLIDDLKTATKGFENFTKLADKSALDILSQLAESTRSLEYGVSVAEATIKASKDLGLEEGVKIGQASLAQFSQSLKSHRKALNLAREIRTLIK